MAALYTLTENYRNLEELIDNPDIPREMIDQALNEVMDSIQDKAVNIAKFMKNIDTEVEQIKLEEQRLAARRRSLVNKSEGLKEYLYEQMKAINLQKFKTPLFSFGIQKNPPSVDIFDESKVPVCYLVEQAPTVDKKAILEALKAGIEVTGTRIKQSEGLRIR